MEIKQIERGGWQKGWHFYLVCALSVLLSGVAIAAIVYFWEEIQESRGYGYASVFFMSILGGITVIPAPSLAVTFTLGRVLNPWYVGIMSGFGEAVGGITTYLTGAGMGSIWSRLQSREQNFESHLGLGYDVVKPVRLQFWSQGQAFYNRLVKWTGGRFGSLVVFLSSAMPLSPYYFAGLAAGSLRTGLVRFFLASLAGKTLRGLTIAFTGYYGIHLIQKWVGG